MLRGFEKLTDELTDDELKKVPSIVKGIGKRIHEWIKKMVRS